MCRRVKKWRYGWPNKFVPVPTIDRFSLAERSRKKNAPGIGRPFRETHYEPRVKIKTFLGVWLYAFLLSIRFAKILHFYFCARARLRGYLCIQVSCVLWRPTFLKKEFSTVSFQLRQALRVRHSNLAFVNQRNLGIIATAGDTGADIAMGH